nr:alanine aminotransferase (GPT) [Polytomella parva]|eukprot:CAMPEP_0175084672 /NCGR_PEP_ID=MMETSP0052_2-20121109/28201_1 /TAXON_ID=51329 ORGANISM="Polytomella parva, Strain SAG 63-3" /NCGR_SAMPLE_ID=MMETSP0052_2 /ASSEMBLY_ACC=CAM_ASM_000194 /LENGTH=488 /DNA_ID=CAMNT_0016356525 /DNA_START=256 /DNA_END=1722 /DNA_ORIENTATION=+
MAPKTSDYLNIKSINECVVATEYAVRGEIVSIAQEMAKVIDAKGKDSGYPFEKIVWCNIGNPHILGQKPITYFRQVLALCEYPALLENPAISQIFPSDVIERANLILKNIPGGVGAYSESAGAFIVRKLVAEAVQRRDGVFCDPDNLFMTDGASPAVHYMMDLLLREDSNDGLMVPIPQYPLYSATLTLYGGHLVPYHLNESSGWSLDVDVLRKNLYAAREKGVCVRGLVVINPGNPTGQCLSDKNIVDIVHFCYDEGLVLIADEVYQTNIYVDDKDFNSFRSVAHREGLLEKLPVVSLHSISKGFVGECGRRGGYMEVTGFPNDVKEQIIKLASINLCPNLSGQICCALMMNPPKEGEPSYELYASERDAILGSLRRRAQVLVSGLRKLEGVTCNDAEGALYAFPCIKLPAQAVAEAKRIGKQPDWLYSREMLDATGIVVVPGSGFGQEDGTYHFRTTFLPSEGDIGSVVDLLSVFHAKFLTKYGGL